MIHDVCAKPASGYLTDEIEIEEIPFTTVKDFSEGPGKLIGNLTLETFNRASQDAVRECLHTLETGLATGKNFMEIYCSLELCLTRLFQNLLAQAGIKNAHLNGNIRESLQNENCCFIPLSPLVYSDEIHQLENLFPKDKLIHFEKKGAIAVNTQAWTIEELVHKKEFLKKQPQLSLADEENEKICILCDHLKLQHPEIVIFKILKVSFILSDQPRTPLSSFIMSNSADGSKRQMTILYPPQIIMKNLRTMLTGIFVLILNWHKNCAQPLDDFVVQFAHLFQQGGVFGNGTSWCLEVLTKVFYKFHGFRLVNQIEPWVVATTPFLEDLVKKVLINKVLKPVTPISSEKTINHLRTKIDTALALRLELHGARLKDILTGWMVTQKERQRDSESKDLRLDLLKKEQQYHQNQYKFFKDLQQLIPTIPLKDVYEKLTIARRYNLVNHAGYHYSLRGPYRLKNEVKGWYLSFDKAREPAPNFLQGAALSDFQKQIIQDQGADFHFPIDRITVETLMDLSQVSDEEALAHYFRMTTEHTRISNNAIMHVMYYDPEKKQHQGYTVLPFVLIKDQRLLLYKLHANNYPIFISQIAAFGRAEDRFRAILDEDMRAMIKLTNLIIAFKDKLDREVPSIAPRPLLKALPFDKSDINTTLALLNQPAPKRKPKKDDELPPEPTVEVPKPVPVILPEVKESKIHYLGTKEYEYFLTIMEANKNNITWKEAVKCLADLGFSKQPAGGKIYKFKYQNVTAGIIQKSGAIEEFDSVSKNFHEPHGPGRHAKDPLPDGMIERFRTLLHNAGMNLDTVKNNR